MFQIHFDLHVNEEKKAEQEPNKKNKQTEKITPIIQQKNSLKYLICNT